VIWGVLSVVAGSILLWAIDQATPTPS